MNTVEIYHLPGTMVMMKIQESVDAPDLKSVED